MLKLIDKLAARYQLCRHKRAAHRTLLIYRKPNGAVVFL